VFGTQEKLKKHVEEIQPRREMSGLPQERWPSRTGERETGRRGVFGTIADGWSVELGLSGESVVEEGVGEEV
jgi:hypothetical protein